MDATQADAFRRLLTGQPVAALATLHQGRPAISMVPFALLGAGDGFVIHVSRLATHTRNMSDNPAVALLVTGTLADAETPLALPRASIQGRARHCGPESPDYGPARSAYLTRRPEAEELFAFADFSLFIIEPESVRYVAGFGAAVSLSSGRMQALLSGPR